MLIFKILTAAIFIGIGGAIFFKKYRNIGWLPVLASGFSIVAAFYLIGSIKEDVVGPGGAISHSSISPGEESNLCSSSFVILSKQDQQCGFSLTSDLVFSYKGRFIAQDLISSYSSDGNHVLVDVMKIFPSSNSERFYFIKACEYQDESNSAGADHSLGLCWTQFLFDAENWSFIRIAAGKYGPRDWIQWSSDDRYAIVYSYNEGVYWFHAYDPRNGNEFLFPPSFDENFESYYELTDVDESSFEWLSSRSFRVIASYRRYSTLDSWDLVYEAENEMMYLEITPAGLVLADR